MALPRTLCRESETKAFWLPCGTRVARNPEPAVHTSGFSVLKFVFTFSSGSAFLVQVRDAIALNAGLLPFPEYQVSTTEPESPPLMKRMLKSPRFHRTPEPRTATRTLKQNRT